MNAILPIFLFLLVREQQSALDLQTLLSQVRSPDQLVRLRALEDLGAMGSGAAPAVPAIIAALEDSSLRTDVFTVSAAVDVLGEIGGPAKEALPTLRRLLRDKTVTSANQGDTAIAIWKIQLYDPKPSVRIRAAQNLGKSSPSAMPALRRALADPDPTVREAVQRALDELNRLNVKP